MRAPCLIAAVACLTLAACGSPQPASEAQDAESAAASAAEDVNDTTSPADTPAEDPVHAERVAFLTRGYWVDSPDCGPSGYFAKFETSGEVSYFGQFGTWSLDGQEIALDLEALPADFMDGPMDAWQGTAVVQFVSEDHIVLTGEDGPSSLYRCPDPE